MALILELEKVKVRFSWSKFSRPIENPPRGKVVAMMLPNGVPAMLYFRCDLS